MYLKRELTRTEVKEHIIKLEKKLFTGSPIFANGEEFIPSDSPSLKYVGDPSPDIDQAWEELIHSRYFYITEQEAADAWGEDYQKYWDPKREGYVAGFDIFHTLHCIDHIRKAFFPDIYQMSDVHGRLHRDHCIDHLRQMVMCYSDMTLIPTVYYESLGYNYINSDRNHTCRNYEKVREYTTERSNGKLAIRPYIMIES
ncbi:hypothetical protein BGW36DRAFT_362038 [Talaromyces proteolyticus]|uniref:Uncharacterized protein n=1 Tax=Talaromyces proteolyticus TaxID=1131652 RepID=A0AAD4KNF3_9EURO|nr:uncharacterized protein BGW36DRAFT_362038 [Talaromyces proteolyticus]KAH8694220.1 hypothetical protein BGW36DRAFT_362038 [Talaromyces proteolyticus]